MVDGIPKREVQPLKKACTTVCSGFFKMMKTAEKKIGIAF